MRRSKAHFLNNSIQGSSKFTRAIRLDPRMKSIHDRIAKWRGKQKAKMAVARHMLEIVWHMLSTMEEYRTKNDEMVRRKFKLMKRVSRAT